MEFSSIEFSDYDTLIRKLNKKQREFIYENFQSELEAHYELPIDEIVDKFE